MNTWFITGGTPGGFGMAYAEAALADGDRVALTARRPDQLEAWARPYGNRVLVLPLDVTEPKHVEEAVRTAEEHFGGIDVLVDNAHPGDGGGARRLSHPRLHRFCGRGRRGDARAAMIEQDGNQPGDPRRGVRAVLAAMAQQTPPHRLVLGNAEFDAVVSTLTKTLDDVRASQALARGADFPAS